MTLVQVDPDGKLALLVPNGFSPQGVRLRKGERLRLPADRDEFDLDTTKPRRRTNQLPIILKPLAQQFNRADWVTTDLVLTTKK